jgi:hypothetical protein
MNSASPRAQHSFQTQPPLIPTEAAQPLTIFVWSTAPRIIPETSMTTFYYTPQTFFIVLATMVVKLSVLCFGHEFAYGWRREGWNVVWIQYKRGDVRKACVIYFLSSRYTSCPPIDRRSPYPIPNTINPKSLKPTCPNSKPPDSKPPGSVF